MEKILVAMDIGKTSIWTAIHGLNLARRINAKVHVLIVSARADAKGIEKQLHIHAKEEIDSLIEEARSEGISVDLYMTQGDYEQEIPRFIKQNNINLLIMGIPRLKNGELTTRFYQMVEKIKRRVDCRIEIVNEKGFQIPDKRSK